jgi:type IV pilus assembly protein PilM
MNMTLPTFKSLSLLKKSRGLLGVDLGTTSIKIVRLERRGANWSLAHCGVIPYGEDLPMDAPLNERRLQAADALIGYLSENLLGQKRTAFSISGNSVIVRYVKLPKMKTDELKESLKFEAEPYIPFNIDDVNLGYFIIGDTLEDGRPMMETVLVAAKKDAVETKTDILKEAGLQPVILDVDAFALESIYEIIAPGTTDTVIFMNIGATATSISIVEKGISKVVRDVFIAGNSFTKALQRQMQCDIKTAEEKKKIWGLSEGSGDSEAQQIYDALIPVVQDLAAEVRRSIDFYLSQGPDRSVQKILLCGGSASLKNIDKFLARDLAVSTEIFNPFTAFGDILITDENRSQLPQMAVAAGMAMRNEQDEYS